jgi:hypothetical protein
LKLIIVFWVFSLGTMTGIKDIFNGTIDDCLTKAQLFNGEQTEAIAGCYPDKVPANYVPPEKHNGFQYNPEEESY